MARYGCDPRDASTWTRPVIRLGMYGQEPFVDSANTPVLHAAFDQLVEDDPVDVGALARYDRPMPTVADYDVLLQSSPCAGTA